MRIESATLCEQITFRGRLLDVEGVGLRSFSLSELPADLSLLILLQFVGLENEMQPDVEHELEVALLNPTIGPIEYLEVTFEPSGPGPDHVPGWEVTEYWPLELTFQPEVEGIYSVDIYLDDRLARTVPFIIKRA